MATHALIVPSPNESLDRTIRRFRQACSRAGMMSAMRRHQEYLKPGERKRRKSRIARRRVAKTARAVAKLEND